MPLLNLQINTSAGDGKQDSAGAMSIASASETITSQNGYFGFVFQNITITQGAVINSATFEVYCLGTNDDLVATAYGDDSDNAALLTTTTNDISARTHTTATTSINQVNVGVAWVSVDVTAIVQEIINRAGWASGNRLGIMLDAESGISFKARMYDGDTTKAAKLSINYTGIPLPSNVDLIRSAAVIASYTNIQDAVGSAIANDIIEIGDDAGVYFEAVDLTGKSNLTIRPKSGDSPIIRGCIADLVNAPSGQWTFYGSVNGHDVYYTAYPYTNNRAECIRHSTGRKLWTYGSWANFVSDPTNGQHAGEGIYVDYAADRCYITLTGNANPNNDTFRISFAKYVFNFYNTNNCTIEDLTIECGGDAVIHLQISDGNTIQRCNIGGSQYGFWFKDTGSTDCSDNIIQDNNIIDDYDEVDWEWDDVKLYSPKMMETAGIKQAACGTGNIFRRNIISKWFNGVNMNRGTAGSPYLDGTKCYENTIHDIPDDAFEPENYVRNIQFYNNFIYNAYVSFSYTPLPDGPIYIYRNRVIADKVQLNQSSTPRVTKRDPGDTVTGIKVYHNTLYSTNDVVQHGVGSGFTNTVFLNNIFYTLGGTTSQTVEGTPIYTETGNDFDGNCHYRVDNTGNLLRNFCDGSSAFASLAAFVASGLGSASGWEANGIEADPLIDTGSYPYSLLLTSGSSPCVGAGVSIGALPDETAWAGNLTIGARPFDAGTPSSGSGRTTGIVRGAVNTTTGNQTFRDANLHVTPNAAIFIMSHAVTDGTQANHNVASLGAATSTSARWCLSYFEEHNLATTNCRRRSVSDGVCLIIDNANTVVAKADFVQWEADAGSGAGVTINWSNAPESAFLLTVILFKADNALAGVLTTHATVNNTVTVTPSFQSSLMLFATNNLAIPGNSSDRYFSIGFADRNLNQRCYMTRSGTGAGATADSARYMTNRVCGEIDNLGAITWTMELTSVTSTTFVLTQRTAGDGVDQVGYLALDLGVLSYWVGDANTPTATGIQANTSPNFKPQLVMMGLSIMEAVDTAATDAKAGAYGISAFNPSNQYTNYWMSDDAADPTVCKSLSDDHAVVMNNDDGSALLDATFSSMDTAGFSLNYSDIEATAKKVFALAIQGAAGTIPIMIHNYRRRRV